MPGCKEVFRGQFRKKCLTFCVTDNRSLLTFAWWSKQKEIPRLVYAIYRLCVFTYFLVWFVFVSNEGVSQLTQLTNLSFNLLTFYLGWGTVVSIVRLGLDWKKLKSGDVHPGDEEKNTLEGSNSESKQTLPQDSDVSTKPDAGAAEKGGVVVKDDLSDGSNPLDDDYDSWVQVPWDLLIMWLLFSINLGAAVMVTVGYWTILFPTVLTTGAHDLHVHLFNGLIMIVEVLVTGYPVRLVHWIYPAAYLMCYIIFTLIYYGVTKTAVYEFLNWAQGYTIAVVLALFILDALLYLGCFGIYLAREHCIKKRDARRAGVKE